MQELETARIAPSYFAPSPATICLAWLGLVVCDVVMKGAGFRSLHKLVTRWPLPDGAVQSRDASLDVCAAVDRAAMFYFKSARCLQRSAAMTCLLRWRGFRAHMVIGCRKLPFHGHAWVEVDGEVVGDTKKVREFYSVLDRW